MTIRINQIETLAETHVILIEDRIRKGLAMQLDDAIASQVARLSKEGKRVWPMSLIALRQSIYPYDNPEEEILTVNRYGPTEATDRNTGEHLFTSVRNNTAGI